MLTKKQRIAIGKASMKKRWGLRVIMSVFPINGGNHRVTLSYQGEEYTFAGNDRGKVMDAAFRRWEQLVSKSFSPQHGK